MFCSESWITPGTAGAAAGAETGGLAGVGAGAAAAGASAGGATVGGATGGGTICALWTGGCGAGAGIAEGRPVAEKDGCEASAGGVEAYCGCGAVTNFTALPVAT